VGTSATSSIGKLSVSGDLIASSIVAGAKNTDWPNFGTSIDMPIASSPTAKISSIVIKGYVMGTTDEFSATDHFGFVAPSIGSVKIGSATQAIPAAGNATEIGATGDFTIRIV
jgi:hypothetical protein